MLDVAILFTLSTGACLYVAFAAPGERALALRIYLLFLGALLMLVVVSGVSAAAPRERTSDLTAALDERPEPRERFAPGIPEHELRALVADLEAIR